MNMRSRHVILVFLIFFLPLGIFASSGLRITEEKGFFALPSSIRGVLIVKVNSEVLKVIK